jgi:diacylglycerol kinase family enzyme
MMVLAANGTHFGSGMRVAPNAKLDDGMLDVIVGGDLSRWQSLVALGKIYGGTHVNGRTIFHFRAKEVEVDFDTPLPGQLDGEVETLTDLRMRVRPGALTVLGR